MWSDGEKRKGRVRERWGTSENHHILHGTQIVIAVGGEITLTVLLIFLLVILSSKVSSLMPHFK